MATRTMTVTRTSFANPWYSLSKSRWYGRCDGVGVSRDKDGAGRGDARPVYEWSRAACEATYISSFNFVLKISYKVRCGTPTSPADSGHHFSHTLQPPEKIARLYPSGLYGLSIFTTQRPNSVTDASIQTSVLVGFDTAHTCADEFCPCKDVKAYSDRTGLPFVRLLLDPVGISRNTSTNLSPAPHKELSARSTCLSEVQKPEMTPAYQWAYGCRAVVALAELELVVWVQLLGNAQPLNRCHAALPPGKSGFQIMGEKFSIFYPMIWRPLLPEPKATRPRLNKNGLEGHISGTYGLQNSSYTNRTPDGTVVPDIPIVTSLSRVTPGYNSDARLPFLIDNLDRDKMTANLRVVWRKSCVDASKALTDNSSRRSPQSDDTGDEFLLFLTSSCFGPFHAMFCYVWHVPAPEHRQSSPHGEKNWRKKWMSEEKKTEAVVNVRPLRRRVRAIDYRTIGIWLVLVQGRTTSGWTRASWGPVSRSFGARTRPPRPVLRSLARPAVRVTAPVIDRLVVEIPKLDRGRDPAASSPEIHEQNEEQRELQNRFSGPVAGHWTL
ncbi:hypothetical protein H4582DRAFT_2128202 [Lactarius indigo]|nr:hypothetical protein H4582DRAFT_2128202 [Lactarius indigo]